MRVKRSNAMCRTVILCFLALFSFWFSCKSSRTLPKQFTSRIDREYEIFAPLFDQTVFADEHRSDIYSGLVRSNIREGDIILRLMDGASSLLTAFSGLGSCSHVGIIVNDDSTLCVVDCQPHNAEVMGEHCIKHHTLKEWVSDMSFRGQIHKVITARIVRPVQPTERNKLYDLINDYLFGCVHFDGEFKLYNDDAQCQNLYCSEFVYEIYRHLNKSTDFVMPSDTITNSLIDRVLDMKNEKSNDFIRMLETIESRYSSELRSVEDLITPASFEWSTAFEPVCIAIHPDLGDSGYDVLLNAHSTISRAILFYRALDGLSCQIDLQPLLKYAKIRAATSSMILDVIDQYKKDNAALFYNGNELIHSHLCKIAGSDELFTLLGRSLAKMKRQGHPGQS